MSVSLPKRKSIIKPESTWAKTILTAIPDSVEFRNYKSNKLYKKVVFLQNVSTSLARFQLVPRPRNSRFTVMVDYKEERPGIPPGMRVKLIISFRCDVLDEPEETLIVNVQQGRPVIIKLRGYRDPPILRVFNIPYFQYPRKEPCTGERETELVAEIPFEHTYSCKEFTSSTSSDSPSSDSPSSDSSSTSAEGISHCRKLKNFDCGPCPVGEQVTISLIVKNIGSEGRFFIMSEIDWCSMHVEDVTDKNVLVLTSFAIWPAYFALKPQEYTHLYLYFFPSAHGTQVETLYAICDNCSVVTMEIIGDGIAYE